MKQEVLDALVHRVASSKGIHGALFHVREWNSSREWRSASGNLNPESRFYIASINKILLATLALRHVHRGEVSLEDRLVAHCSGLPVGFHRFKGTVYSHRITLRHLLSHTTGLPCYLLDKKEDGTRSMKQILNGDDQAWPLDAVLDSVTRMGGRFIPGHPGKAHYSETNYRLLGLWLETLTGMPVQEQLTSLFTELDMKETHLLPTTDIDYTPVYYKEAQLNLDRYWRSTGHDLISTSADLMTFLSAVHSGHLYPMEWMQSEEHWNRIFFPFRYGLGRQQFSIPRILSPFRAVPEMVGHSGSCGSFAFYVPEPSLLITGTTNQTAKPAAPFQVMAKIATQ